MKQGEIDLLPGVERERAYEDAGCRVEDLCSVAGKYRTIYCDPPWQYADGGCGGAAEKEYRTLPTQDIARLPGVKDLAHADGAHLWMWTTWPMIRQGEPKVLLDAWGFRWVGEIIWQKPGLGVGRWLRPSTEVLILGERGKLPLLRNNQRGHYEARREGHSVKPEGFAQLIETLSPGPRIELFARRPRGNWDRWGNQS